MISLFERYFGKINYLNQYNRQAFIISADNTEEKDIVNTIRTIYNIFIKENKHVHVRIGIGEIAQGLELGIYQLLFYIDDTSKIDDYVKEILNPLLIYDKKNNQNLIDTLREYLKCGQNVSQASQNLYIHRNTMIKRVEKIEELIGCSIKNAEVTNQLYNAVKIYDLFLKK